MTNNAYDVIVVGSGAGGMSTAVPLAQAGKKVLVLEQHDVPGGWTHSFTNKTEIDGLWLCGASTTAGHGVAGATNSGLMTARQILGCRTRDLLQQNGPPLAVYPSEAPDMWPEKLRRRMQRL